MKFLLTGTQDLLARTRSKRRPAVAALLQGIAIGAMMVCSSAPAHAAAIFGADSRIEVSVQVASESLGVVIPSDAAVTGALAQKSPADADATGTANGDATANYEDTTLALFAEASVSGSATSGSVTASAFGSALAYLRALNGAPTEIDILIEDAFIQTITGTPSPGDFASANAGWTVDLTLNGEDVFLTKIEGGWRVNLLPYDIPSSDLKREYHLSVYAAAEGEASAVPEPTTLTLLGVGLAGIGAVRRRKLTA